MDGAARRARACRAARATSHARARRAPRSGRSRPCSPGGAAVLLDAEEEMVGQPDRVEARGPRHARAQCSTVSQRSGCSPGTEKSNCGRASPMSIGCATVEPGARCRDQRERGAARHGHHRDRRRRGLVPARRAHRPTPPPVGAHARRRRVEAAARALAMHGRVGRRPAVPSRRAPEARRSRRRAVRAPRATDAGRRTRRAGALRGLDERGARRAVLPLRRAHLAARGAPPGVPHPVAGHRPGAPAPDAPAPPAWAPGPCSWRTTSWLARARAMDAAAPRRRAAMRGPARARARLRGRRPRAGVDEPASTPSRSVPRRPTTRSLATRAGRPAPSWSGSCPRPCSTRCRRHRWAELDLDPAAPSRPGSRSRPP